MKYLLKIRSGKRVLALLPTKSLLGLAISVLVITAACWALETRLAPKSDRLSHWYWEDKRINLNNEFKNYADTSLPIWRSDGFPVTVARKKTRRILVLGDSFAWGDGYANMNDLWWRQLERELWRRGYRHVEVIAAGLPGYSTSDQLAVLGTVLDQAKPDLLLWGYTTNDPDEGIVPILDENRLARKDSLYRFLNRASTGRLFPGLVCFLRDGRQERVAVGAAGAKNGFRYARWELELLKGENFTKYESTAARLSQKVRTLDIPVFYVTLPADPSIEYHRPRFEPVRALYERLGVPFFDVLDKVHSMLCSGRDADLDVQWGINPVNRHPGAAVTHACAVAVCDVLEKEAAEVLESPSIDHPDPAPIINDWMPFDLGVERRSDETWTMTVPRSSKYMPRMPDDEPFLLLSLALPVVLSEVELHGENLAEVSIETTGVSPNSGFDDGSTQRYPQRNGPTARWDVGEKSDAQAVNTLRIKPRFSGNDRALRLRLVPGKSSPTLDVK